MKTISRDELASCNGSDGSPVYVAYKGKVYDVTGSPLWRTGVHMRRHQAGADLTSDFAAAPHGEEVLARYPQVGTLADSAAVEESHLPAFLERLYQHVPMLRRHPHPMTVHFPIAFVTLTPILNFLALATKNNVLEQSAFVVLAAALVSIPIAMLTGPYNWWINYGGRWNKIIVVKFAASLLLVLLAAGLFLWRLTDPGIMAGASIGRSFYLLLNVALLPVIITLGWNGAKLTFPH